MRTKVPDVSDSVCEAWKQDNHVEKICHMTLSILLETDPDFFQRLKEKLHLISNWIVQDMIKKN